MDTPTTTSPPLTTKTKHPIPPPWYNLQSTNSHPYIALPPTTTRPPIFLTTFYPADGPALQAILSLPSINASLISVPHPYTLSDAHFWLNLQCNPITNPDPTSTTNNSPPGPWLQALRTNHPDETGTLIGAASLTPVDSSSYALRGLHHENAAGEAKDENARDSYILGYYLDPAQQNRGIMRDAVRALIAWGVAEKGVRVVRVDVVGENRASRAVVEGIEGFDRVGGGGVEVGWPEEKGGGVKRVGSWVWRV